MNAGRLNSNKQINLIIDSLFMILAFFVTYYIREPIDTHPFKQMGEIDQYLWVLAVSLPFSWLSLLFLGAYSSKPEPRNYLRNLFARVFLAMLFVLSLIFFLFNIDSVNRTFVVPFLFLSALLFVSWRALVLRWQSSRGTLRRALLIGDPDRLPKIIEDLRKDSPAGFEFIGCLTELEHPRTTVEELPVFGDLDDLYGVLHKNVVDEVILSTTISEIEKYQALVKICETVGVSVLILLDDQWPKFTRVDVGKLLNRPFLYLDSQHKSEIGSVIKALLDRAAALLILTILFPLMFVIGILVKFTSNGPVFFVQERTGLNGRRFRMYKFRTMAVDAAERKELLKAMNEMDGPVFKIKKDPRVTAIGAWLRKYSLDELPQLWNVLLGDMSLVGPRPLPCEEAELIHGMQRRRFCVKPGLTCIWQVSGRNHLSYEEWMKLDLQYVDDWSLGLDLRILLKTPAAIFSSKGAF
jgi:exopolysaccharide biosynthesis polyprenyl glycosylphosphotransferase